MPTIGEVMNLLDAVRLAERIRKSSPVRKDADGKYTCRYCDAAVNDEAGEPVIIHARDCVYLLAKATH